MLTSKIKPLALQTRKRRDIDNTLNHDDVAIGMQQLVQDLKKKHLSATHRDVGPCNTYNCHGLTFASRRTNIEDAAEIRKILEDDGYIEINLENISPGDIALYFISGDVEHSGIVVEIMDLGPKILSKWGPAQEAIHNLGDCPYDASNVRFFRVHK